ncbi:hypothetical protein GENT5_07520 [Flavobacterium ammoniigenes]|jgi:hypothetical protein|uniref:Uncharacterized protein n=2 Tax=Flavobacterium ammoniigenes TaxID=1751095 RepID=A0ABN6L1E7_9FLAO|nr:hypothetical protein GENT5_07520 [Flavobacterium ammoniigenes]
MVYKFKTMRNLFYLVVIIGPFLNSTAQTGIGTTTPNASAKLDVSATDRGFLPPRVALTATNAFSPITGTSSAAAGLLIYNTATAGTAPTNVVPGYYYWNGTAWIQIAPGLIIDTSKTAGFTLAATDNNKVFLITSATNSTVTVPSSLPVGFSCQLIQGGLGTITVTGSSVTLNSSNGFTTRATNSVIGLVMTTTTTGFVFGDSIF